MNFHLWTPDAGCFAPPVAVNARNMREELARLLNKASCATEQHGKCVLVGDREFVDAVQAPSGVQIRGMRVAVAEPYRVSSAAAPVDNGTFLSYK